MSGRRTGGNGQIYRDNVADSESEVVTWAQGLGLNGAG